MKLTSDLHVVGGGYFGFGLSGRLDCHVLVLNSGDELALIDPGMGMDKDFDTILDHIRDDGLDPGKIRKMILTHYHCDHIGAAAEAQKRLDVEVYSSAFAAPVIRERRRKSCGARCRQGGQLLSRRLSPSALPGGCRIGRGRCRQGRQSGAGELRDAGTLRWPSQLSDARGRPDLSARRRSGVLGWQGRLAEHPRLPHRRLRQQHVQNGEIRF